MSFKKSLFGYKKEEVMKHVEDIKNQQEDDKRDILNKIQLLNLEYNNLKEKNLILTKSLKSIEDNTAFIENNSDYFDKVLRNAKLEATARLERIKVDQKETFEKIIQSASRLDELSSILRSDLSEINLSLQNIINKISIRHEIDDYLTKVNEIIENNQSNSLEINSDLNRLNYLEKQIINNKPLRPRLALIENKDDNQNDIKLKDFKRYLTKDNNLAKESPEINNEEKSIKSDFNRGLLNNIRPKTVLIGMRSEDTIDLLSVILKRDGYEISYSKDGNEILNMLNDVEPYGILILDAMIPYVEVGSLIKKIRKNESWCDVPILIISSETRAESAVKYLAEGANDFLSTPFNPKELLARVNRLNKYPPYACMTEIL